MSINIGGSGVGRIFFTSDTHLGHANIIRYCNRPFSNVEEMDAELIHRWNEAVSEDDVVYFLGDFCMGDPRRFYSRLNGTVYMIPGGHDKELRKLDQQFILPPIYVLKGLLDDKRLGITLCHYAMRTFPQSHYGAIHLYGHSHGRLARIGRSMDVGVDTNNYYPYSLNEIITKMESYVWQET